MSFASLTALSPLDGRYAHQLEPLRSIFSESALMRARIRVEIEWLLALSASKDIPEIKPLTTTEKKRLLALITDFSLEDAKRIKAIEVETRHDVKAIEYYLKERIASDADLSPLSEFFHFACTSEDINNLAYGLLLHEARMHLFLPTLTNVIDTLRETSHRYASSAMLALTHGQPASPTSLGKEFANIVARLQRQHTQLSALSILGKINGAVGNFNAHYIAYPEVSWPTLAQSVVQNLGLTWNPYTTQIEPHDTIAEYAQNIARINIILIDCARDIWGYISRGYFTQVTHKNEVGSSTMPHKINPIDFENAEGNLGIANALWNHFAEKLPISRFQRDLTDSTVLRNIGVAVGHTVLGWNNFLAGLNRLSVNETALTTDLNQHWEVLGEAIQTVMRRYGLPMPYEQLKTLTRGQSVDAKAMHQFIQQLALPQDAKTRLLALTPKDYMGNATKLATDI